MAEPADDHAAGTGELTLAQVAARAGVSPATVRRWVDGGLIPGYDGSWTPATAAYARVVARLRARGHTLAQIKRAGENGQLAVGPLENLLSRPGPRYPMRETARLTGVDPELIGRLYTMMGLGAQPPDEFSDEDVQILKYVAAVLDAGLPLPAFLQLMRVYGQAVAQIADAEVRLIHLYVHEPLMRADVPSVEIAEEMEGLTREILPFATPFMNYLHGRLLAQFVEQDMIGHMEADLGEDALEEGRLRVAIAFADLAGYARLTNERGDEAALGTVERFVQAVEQTLPVDARVIKTLGDEVMVVASDAAALAAWAVELRSGIAVGRSAAADRHPLRRGAVSRRRLLRPRRQPGGARGRARGRRRGAGHAPGRRAGGRARGPRLRADRRGQAEGLLRADRAVHRHRQERLAAMVCEQVREAVRAGGLFARDRPVVAMLSGGRDSTCLLDVAVALLRPGRDQRAARQLRPARAVRRGRGALRAAVRAARGRARDRARQRSAALARGARDAGAGNLQAWARDVRYARGRPHRRRARRADRHRAHRQRPGRDDPLSPRGLAGAPGAAGDGRQRGTPDPPAARRQPRADGRVLPRPRPELAR